jgi:bifunctional non-homologous end joining protein LigD
MPADQDAASAERRCLAKHDGFGVIARKDGDRVRLYSRPGNDLTDRFPLTVWRGCARAPASSTARRCAAATTACRASTASATAATVFLYAFDLIELDGDDLRNEPLAARKATLASLLRFKTKFKVESTGGRYPEDQWYA